MKSKILRMIDSAQRRVVIARPNAPQSPGLTEVVFEIQGIHMVFGERREFHEYADMAERGVRRGWCKPLTLMERLKRLPAKIGTMERKPDGRLHLIFWNDAALELVFELTSDEQAGLWRETEIMTMSAGFHFHEKNA